MFPESQRQLLVLTVLHVPFSAFGCGVQPLPIAQLPVSGPSWLKGVGVFACSARGNKPLFPCP